MRARCFQTDRDGSTAVEFALVLPVLVLMLMAVMQISLVFIVGQHLENATATLGRLVRTGQAQGQKLDQTAFQAALCEEMKPLLDCASANFMMDVRTLPNFGPVDLEWPLDDDGNFAGAGTYNPGVAGEIVLVRTFVQYPIWLPIIGATLTNLPNGKRLIVSSAAFRNEPF
jgi:Flp pilus assembly protein TadG